jgi:hypothetical protein
VIEYPAYRPSDVSLRLPSQPVMPNFWRSTEAPEITGSIPEGAELRLTYRNVPDSEALELLLCWRVTAGGVFPFPTLPAQVAAGVENAAMARRITTPTPLVWVLAEPPRQSPAKAGRSTVEVFLRTELRFNLVLTGPPSPEPLDLPLMWASRMIEPLDNEPMPSAAQMCPDGHSYQVSYIRTQIDNSVTHMLVVYRNPSGEILWQRQMIDVLNMGSFVPKPKDHHFGLAVGQDNQLFITYYHPAAQREFAGQANVNSGNPGFKFLACSVNSDGNIVWQKRYQFSNVHRQDGTLWKSTVEHTVTCVTYNEVTNELLLCAVSDLGGSTGSGGAFVGILRASAASGSPLSSKTFWAPFQASSGGTIRVGHCVIRNSRIYLFATRIHPSSNDHFPFVIELSLDLAIVFQTYRFQEFAWWQVIPVSDGGWIAYGELQNGTKAAWKFSSNFDPIWRKTDATSAAQIYAQNLTRLTPTQLNRVKQVEGNYVYATRHHNIAAFRPRKALNAANFSSSVSGFSLIYYDNDSQNAGASVTTSQVAGGGDAFQSNSCNFFGDFYSPLTDRCVTTTVNPAGPTFGRLVASGFAGRMPDEGERWLDIGLDDNASFTMVARSQLSTPYSPIVTFGAPSDLPIKVDAELAPTTHSLSAADTSFTWDESSYVFNYYSYRDPEFIAPAAEGQSGIGFYAGNNAGQKVNVGAQFTPAFILHANRAGGANVIKWASNLALNLQMRWGTNSVTTLIQENNYLQGVGEGFFTISGRNTNPDWNRIANNYVAIALAAVTGGYEAITYTGNGSSPRAISHSLGDTPEFMFVRAGATIEPASGSLIGSGNRVDMRSTAARTADSARIAAVAASDFTAGSSLNANGIVHHAYLFRSCPGWDLGTYAGDGAATETVTLGYQPKAIIIKTIIGGTSDWLLLYRPDGTTGLCQSMALNTTAAEATSTTVSITATGFTVAVGGVGNTGGVTALYWALR